MRSILQLFLVSGRLRGNGRRGRPSRCLTSQILGASTLTQKKSQQNMKENREVSWPTFKSWGISSVTPKSRSDREPCGECMSESEHPEISWALWDALSSSAHLQVTAMCSRAWGLLVIPKMEVRNDGVHILINSVADSAMKNRCLSPSFSLFR